MRAIVLPFILLHIIIENVEGIKYRGSSATISREPQSFDADLPF